LTVSSGSPDTVNLTVSPALTFVRSVHLEVEVLDGLQAFIGQRSAFGSHTFRQENGQAGQAGRTAEISNSSAFGTVVKAINP
jgi:hypothetical protein